MADLSKLTRLIPGWTTGQDVLGAVAGAVESRALPSAGPDGTIKWTSRNPDSVPRALGNSLIVPPRGADPVEEAHELRHVRQSNLLGPAQIPASLIGGDLGTLEEDAYTATEPEGSAELSNRAQFQKAAGVEPSGAGLAFLRGLLGDE